MIKRLAFLLCLTVTMCLVGSNTALGAVLDIRTANSTDDAEEHLNAGMDLTSSDFELPLEDDGTPSATDEQLCAARWIIPLDKGRAAGVGKVYIEFVMKEIKGQTNTWPVNLIIEGQLAANPPAFTSAAKDITNRPRTKAQVKWTIPTGIALETAFQTPDISSIIKEIMSQDGWASGNALVIIFRDDKSAPSTGIRTVYTYNGSATKAPLLHIEVFIPEAAKPVPASGSTEINSPLFQWTAGDGAVLHEIYMGTNPTPGPAEFMGPWPTNMYFHIPGLTPGATYYWRVDEVDAAGVKYPGPVWTFTVQPLEAHFPSPYDGQLWRSLSTQLKWTAGQGAMKHKVFLGSDKALVTAGDAKALAGEATTADFTPTNLASNTQYYWRVDEVDSTGKVAAGPVWSFSTIDTAGGAVAEYWNDINLINNNIIALAGAPAVVTTVQSVNFSWPDGTVKGTNSPDPNINTNYFAARYTALLKVPASGKYKLYVGSDDGGRLFLDGVQIAGSWVNRGETENASAELDLVAGQQYVVVMEMYEATGGAAARLRWSGPGIAKEIIPPGALQIPKFAVSPIPREGEVEVADNAVMSFTPGRKAVVHTVYFGTSKSNVTKGDKSVALPPAAEAKYVPAKALTRNTTYYWKVDEMAADGTTTTSPVWSFKTADWIVVQPAQVTGLTYQQTLNYDNTKAPFLSQLAFNVPADLTAGGVSDLALRFQGNPARYIDKGNGAFTVGASGHDIWDAADDFRFVYKKLSGNGSAVVKVESLVNTNAWAKGGVMIRETLEDGSKMAYAVISFSSGAAFGQRVTKGVGAIDGAPTVSAIRAPQWVKLTRTGDVFSAQYSADGQTWLDFKSPALTGTVKTCTIPMAADVYIGLCVTSHNAASTTTAQLSGTALTGNVTGAWQQVWIGDDPDRTNDVASLYVAVEDKAGKMALVTNPNPAAVNTTVLDLWRVPMSAFTGVDLKNAVKLYVGVGDGKAGGAGTTTFADIRIIKPVAGVPDPNAVDVTKKGDPLVGVPNDGVNTGGNTAGWPAAEIPANVIDDSATTKFLHFKGEVEPTGFSVTPSVGYTVVTGLTFTTANDTPSRDPITWELYGSVTSIDGPWEPMIAKGTVDDFSRPQDWPRYWKNITPIGFKNGIPYAHYKVMFPTVRYQSNGVYNIPDSMQIAEVELLGLPAKGVTPLVKVNFQSNSQGDKSIPTGYLPDYGLPYGDRGNGFSYGWSRDISADARDRNSAKSPDQRYDTFVHLQKAADAIWEIAIPNGTYQLFIVGGDPDNSDQTVSLDVEGVILPDADGANGDNWDYFTTTVTVKDGRLTIKPAGGAKPPANNAKISFITIAQVAP